MLLVAIAGWYYLFYSRAAQKLSGIELAYFNRWRIRLRRANGLVMLLLAVGMFACVHSVDAQRHPRVFMLGLLAIISLLAMMVGLALADVRLTKRLRQTRSRQAIRDAMKDKIS